MAVMEQGGRDFASRRSEDVKVQKVSQVIREEILKDYTQADQTVIMSVPSASNVEDLTRFDTMSKYFKGSITLRR